MDLLLVYILLQYEYLVCFSLHEGAQAKGKVFISPMHSQKLNGLFYKVSSALHKAC